MRFDKDDKAIDAVHSLLQFIWFRIILSLLKTLSTKWAQQQRQEQIQHLSRQSADAYQSLFISTFYLTHSNAMQLTTKFPITNVSRKKGMHILPLHHIQSHIDSIHSPHSTRKTIMNECKKSIKCQRGCSGNFVTSLYPDPNSCIPITAKIKIIIRSTKQRLPRAPIVRPMMPIRRLRVGHDLASLNTRNWNIETRRRSSHEWTITDNRARRNCSGGGSATTTTAAANHTYQSERPENGQTLDVSQAQFYQTKYNNNKIKTVPLVLHKVDRAEGDDFEHGLSSKYCGKYLKKNTSQCGVRTLRNHQISL